MDIKQKEILEKIVEYTGMVALYLSNSEEGYQLEYVSDTLRQYGIEPEEVLHHAVLLEDRICPKDLEQIRESIDNTVKYGISNLTLECRIITGEQELVPIRLFLYYHYDDQGTPAGVDILIQNLREKAQLNNENVYLNNVISKLKSVLIVKSYCKGKRKLNYISSNAGILGYNTEAVKKGYKLTEDYIYPEDRDDVVNAVYHAMANGVADFTLTYRMVKDDGSRIWVENEVTIARLLDGEAEISFLITDITEQKNVERELEELVKQKKDALDGKEEPTLKPIAVDVHDSGLIKLFESMAENVCINAEYYGVLIDKEGKILSKPIGPERHIGRFYDLTEHIEFKEQFEKISERAEKDRIPQAASYEIDGMEVHMEFIPLILGESIIAYWFLTSFEEDGETLLGSKVDTHWRISNTIVNYFYSEHVIQNEKKHRMLAERQHRRAKQEREIIQNMLEIMIREGRNGLEDIFQNAASYLPLSDFALYVENKENKKVESYFVSNRFGKESDFGEKLQLTISEYKVLKQMFAEQSVLVLDRRIEQPFLRELIRRTDSENMVLMQIALLSGEKGYIVFANSKQEGSFDEKDIAFMNTIRHIFAAAMSSKKTSLTKTGYREIFFETYDYVQEAVFIEDNKSEEIIFANKASDQLFGYSLTGMQVRDVLTDPTGQYGHVHGMSKRFIANKKMTKWQSYIKELDQVMNITEIHIGIREKAGYSLYILNKKDK